MAIVKIIIFFVINKAITKTAFDESTSLSSLGFKLKNETYDDPAPEGLKNLIVIDKWTTFDFEFLALVLNFMLLAFYTVQNNYREQNIGYGYINHSLFLQQYWLF